MKIAILDSGVKTSHTVFNKKEIYGYSLQENQDGIIIRQDDYQDKIGHGTAIFFLIDKYLSDKNVKVEIENIKIFNNEHEIDAKIFENILMYIYSNEDYDILNISMGITNYGDTKNLEVICKKFSERGTLIISAFDNDGAVSFPAALENVIGVDAQKIDIKKDHFIYVKNSIVNIVGKSISVRVPWIAPDYLIVNGSSFLCAKVTATLACEEFKKSGFHISTICDKHLIMEKTINNKMTFSIQKAIVFPFNKEIHSIARNEDLLNFMIVDYYSCRITGQVGKQISKIISNCENPLIIKDINKIEWEAFDTLILGHLDDLSSIAHVDFKNILCKEAQIRGKNIYSFDPLQDVISENIYTPRIDSFNVQKKFGKLYKTIIPILSVIGTNSRQGKYTLQLLLRRYFLKLGYIVGQIGTEPSATLFNMDEIFPCGYNGQVNLDNNQIYSIINQMVWDISQKDVDIIITGTQSGLLAYNDNNVFNIPLLHTIVFAAMKPDAIILCINIFDEISFVERVIKTAEGLTNGKVVGIVCFPVDFEINQRENFSSKVRISIERERVLKKTYKDKLNLNVYMLDRSNEIINLVNDCVEFFCKLG